MKLYHLVAIILFSIGLGLANLNFVWLMTVNAGQYTDFQLIIGVGSWGIFSALAFLAAITFLLIGDSIERSRYNQSKDK